MTSFVKKSRITTSPSSSISGVSPMAFAYCRAFSGVMPSNFSRFAANSAVVSFTSGLIARIRPACSRKGALA